MRFLADTLNETYPAAVASIGPARRAIAEFAVRAGAGVEETRRVKLAASEAITNAVLHAYGDEPGRFHVSVALSCSELWVLIADDGRGIGAPSARPGLGLGLGLVAQMADDMTIVPRAAGGTELRMRFDLVEAESECQPTPPAGAEQAQWAAGLRPAFA